MPFVNVFVNVEKMSVKEFETEVLKKHLNMVAPDVVLDGKGVMVISSEEGETEVSFLLILQLHLANVLFARTEFTRASSPCDLEVDMHY